MPSETAKPSYTNNAALGIAQILLWGGSYFILSVLSKPIMQETGWSYQMVYSALSLALLISGLVLPRIGRIIDAYDKNYILKYAGVTMACGLILMGFSRHFVLYLFSWTIIGISMGMGLYDALFASLGKKYGPGTGKVIVQVTLIASLAPSISWYFLSLMLDTYSWRTVCFIYAAMLLLTIFPLYNFVFRQPGNTHSKRPVVRDTLQGSREILKGQLYYLLLVHFTIGAVVTTGIIVHLIDILSDKSMSMTAVIGTVAFLGPSQAGVRVLELLVSRKSSLLSAVISGIAIMAGILLLSTAPIVAISGVIILGMGNGMRSILRGTLPLEIFGQKQYALIISKLARMPLIAQALTPFITGWLIQQFSVSVFLYIFCTLAFINIILCCIIIKQTKKNGIRI
ncbi:major facilitator superfamily MFS_1 [Chitinophaga pinensis DSM 2588]|uniref:Major facilitator superfamily MFS_1 n=2 Tax=Chitinophaga pinensis TaxID=79329 RepID=A0A979GWN5_CHIPD|nr:major facilitator superfamily MFS_1 [Chitinophaga pinensis DSM 2588]